MNRKTRRNIAQFSHIQGLRPGYLRPLKTEIDLKVEQFLEAYSIVKLEESKVSVEVLSDQAAIEVC